MFTQEYKKAIEQEILFVGESVKLQAERILSFGLDIGELYQFDEICREVVEKYPEVAYVLIYDKNGELLYHSESSEEAVKDIHFDFNVVKQAQEQNTIAKVQLNIDAEKYQATSIPIINDSEAIQGTVLIAFSEEYVTAKTKKLVQYSMLQSVMFIMISFLLLTFVLTKWVTRPLQSIMSVMNAAGLGNLHARVELSSKDEFGMLGMKLNETLEKIKQLMNENEKAVKIQQSFVLEQERGKLSESLREAIFSISSTLDVEEVQQLALTHLRNIIECDRVSMYMKEAGFWKQVATVGEISTRVNEEKLATMYNHVDNIEQPIIEMFHGHQVLYMPFYVHKVYLGVLVIERMAVAFNESEQSLALTYVSQMAIAIDNAKMYEQMEEIAITDALTDSYNRRYFYNVFEQELEKHLHNKQPLAFILFDVDYFKKVNDRNGHVIGDKVLRSLSRETKAYIAPHHVFARLGGEEFAILLPQTSIEQAYQQGEELRQLIANMDVETDSGPLQVTISLGVTNVIPSEKVESVMHRADKALYEAKETGRNKVVSITATS